MCKLFLFCGKNALDLEISNLFEAHAQYYTAQGLISIQSDQTIAAGRNIKQAISEYIAQADAIVWILSANISTDILNIVQQTTQQRKFAIYASHVTSLLIAELLIAENVIMPTPTQPLLSLTESQRHQEMSQIITRIVPIEEAFLQKINLLPLPPPKLI